MNKAVKNTDTTQLASPTPFSWRRALPIIAFVALAGAFIIWRSFAATGVPYRYSVYYCNGGAISQVDSDKTCAPVSSEALAYRLYLGGLGRLPDKSGIVYWRDALIKGSTTPEKMAQKFVRVEPASKSTTQLSDSEFVTKAYTAVLGKQPDAAGRKYWIDQIKTKKKSRSTVIAYFASKAKISVVDANARMAQGQTKSGNEEFVKALYQNMLGRAGDAKGVAYWTKQLDSRTSVPAAVLVAFASGNEAKTYHGPGFATYAKTLPKPTVLSSTPATSGMGTRTTTSGPNPYACGAPYPTISSGTKDASTGRTDKCVSAVQYNLRKANPNVGVTGVVDANTIAAIRNFQTYFKQPVTGSLTPKQVGGVAAVWGAYAVSPTVPMTATATNPYACNAPYPTLSSGTKDASAGRTDKCVSAVQFYFKNMAAQRDVIVSGTIDSATVTSIQNFQRLFKLPVTGTLTPAQVENVITILGALPNISVEANNSGTGSNSNPGSNGSNAGDQPKDPNPYACNKPYPAIGNGTKDASNSRTDKCVSAVQFDLKKATSGVEVNGTIDAASVEAIKAFQAYIKVKATGTLTAAQVEKLASAYGPFATSENEVKKGRFNIVMIGAGFSSDESFKVVANGVIRTFSSTEPLASNKANIAYNVISTPDSLGCAMGTTVGRAAACDYTKAAALAASRGVPVDRAIVIWNQSEYGGTGGGNYVTITTSALPQAIHEWGHSMGLVDEYVYEESSTPGYAQYYTDKEPNAIYGQCAGRALSSDWRDTPGPWQVWKDLSNVNWYTGCTAPSWSRPSDHSIMREQWNSFNSVSIKVIQDALDKEFH